MGSTTPECDLAKTSSWHARYAKPVPVSQRFGHPHSHIPSVLGIPFSYYCSVFGHPPVPSRDAQIPSVLGIPSKTIWDFAGKSKTF